MVVMMKVMLSARLRRLISGRAWVAGVFGKTTPDTEAGTGRQRSAASCAVIAWLGIRLCRQFLHYAA